MSTKYEKQELQIYNMSMWKIPFHQENQKEHLFDKRKKIKNRESYRIKN